MDYHWHHIIPRHSGGTDDPSNLVRVTVEEHAELHFARYLLYGELGDYIAYHMLSGKTTEGERALNLMRADYMRNRVVSEESKRRMTEGQKRRHPSTYKRGEEHWNCAGENNPFFGKTHDEETRKKCSDGAKKQWKRNLIWITNGVISKRVIETEIPDGFYKGRKRSK